MHIKSRDKYVVYAAMAAIASFPLLLLAGTQSSNEPWSVSPDSPVIISTTNKVASGAETKFELGASLAADFGYAWLRFYQMYLSSAGTVRCPMEPSCSRYSMLAIDKHGFLCGVMMTADRLIHEADEKKWAIRIGKGSAVRYYDPLENNDFWWYRR